MKSIFLNRKSFKKTSVFSFMSRLLHSSLKTLLKKTEAIGFLPQSYLLQGTIGHIWKWGLWPWQPGWLCQAQAEPLMTSQGHWLGHLPSCVWQMGTLSYCKEMAGSGGCAGVDSACLKENLCLPVYRIWSKYCKVPLHGDCFYPAVGSHQWPVVIGLRGWIYCIVWRRSCQKKKKKPLLNQGCVFCLHF